MDTNTRRNFDSTDYFPIAKRITYRFPFTQVFNFWESIACLCEISRQNPLRGQPNSAIQLKSIAQFFVKINKNKK